MACGCGKSSKQVRPNNVNYYSPNRRNVFRRQPDNLNKQEGQNQVQQDNNKNQK